MSKVNLSTKPLVIEIYKSGGGLCMSHYHDLSFPGLGGESVIIKSTFWEEVKKDPELRGLAMSCVDHILKNLGEEDE